LLQDSREADCGKVIDGQAVMPCGDTAEVLEASEPALDGVAVTVTAPRVIQGHLAATLFSVT